MTDLLKVSQLTFVQLKFNLIVKDTLPLKVLGIGLDELYSVMCINTKF